MAGRTRRRGAENPFVTYCVTNGRGRAPAEPGSGERAELVAVGLAALEPGDDLPALLSHLNANQATLRAEFVREHMAGRGSVFMDLVFVRK